MSTFIGKITSFPLFFLLPAVVASPAAASATTGTDSKAIDQSIVWVDVLWTGDVEVPFTDGTRKIFTGAASGYCTGWFVSDQGHIATAGHCVEKDDGTVLAIYRDIIMDNGWTELKAEAVDWPIHMQDPIVKISQPSGVAGGVLSGKPHLTAQILNKQGFENGDNALLRIADLNDTPALTVATKLPEVGDRVTTIGFPGLVADQYDVDRQKPSYRSGAVSSRSYSKQGVPQTEIDVDIIQGMSGGPTLNEAGEVVGINSSLIAEFQGPVRSSQANYITDLQTLRDFLATNGVNPPVPPTRNPNPNPGPNLNQDAAVANQEAAADIPAWILPIIAVLVLTIAVLIIAGMLVIYVMSQKKRQSAVTSPPQGTAQILPR